MLDLTEEVRVLKIAMITEHIVGDTAFTQLRAEWDQLVAESMTNTPFQLLDYQRAWWSHLQPENSTLHTIAVRNEQQKLVAIGCFFLKDGCFHFNGCIEETDYLDLIVSEANAAAAWTAVFNTLCAPNFPTWQALDLCNIPENSLSRQILAAEAQSRVFTWEETHIEVCPIIQLPNGFEAYLDQIDSKQRRELNRKLRKAEAADAVMHIVGPQDDLTAEVDAFLELLQASTYEKREWLNEGRRAVFHETAQAAFSKGILQLAFMEVDGRKAATLFNFDYNNRIWVYNSGLDPAKFSNLSLGVVMTAKAIEYAAENGRTTFDFLRGNETYKYRFGAEDTAIYRHHINRQ
jgi:CelD/BcsL family acetyltransferase involved in cellulose biosynthesis